MKIDSINDRKKNAYLIETRCKQVERRYDATVRSETVLTHYFLVVYGVANIDRRAKWQLASDSGIQIDQIASFRLPRQFRVPSLNFKTQKTNEI